MIVTQETTTEYRLPINIGIDIGQIHDPTAICVSEVEQVDTGRVRITGKQTLGHHDDHGSWVPPTGSEPVMRSEYIVRFIKRLPLNTSYPDVAIYIADMLDNELFVNRNIRILLDVTGVGRPVYNSLEREISLRRNNTTYHLQMTVGGPTWKTGKHTLHLKPISFTYGETYNRSKGTLGKAFLVSRLQSILQEKRIHGPDTPEMKATLDELRVYQIKVSDEGKEQFGAKIGAHDDLAVAMALSALEDPYSERVFYSERVY